MAEIIKKNKVAPKYQAIFIVSMGEFGRRGGSRLEESKYASECVNDGEAR